MQPGPANYGKKRMFDNKQAIDYSKRFQSLNILHPMSRAANNDTHANPDAAMTIQTSNLRSLNNNDREVKTEMRTHEQESIS